MKERIQDLAILGGPTTFTEPLHVGCPNFIGNDRLFARLGEMLQKKWFSNGGPFLQEFEKRIQDLLGVKHCIGICNGTVALEIVIKALGLTGEVIIPSFTFVATAHVLQWQNITPVFCDVRPDTHTIDPVCIEKLITPRTSGILGVHLWGVPCDIENMQQIANSQNLKVFFDAAHAFGCTCNGKMVGNFGNAEVFSFHATKYLNSCEGGAITTNEDELASRIRLMKNFGFSSCDIVTNIGINGKMNEFSALMGLTNLEDMDFFIYRNKNNYNIYRKYINEIKGIKILNYNDYEKCNYQYVVIEITQPSEVDRDLLLEILRLENILAKRYFYPGCHKMEPYLSKYQFSSLVLPYTEKLTRSTILLPTGIETTEKKIIKICKLLKFVVENSGEIIRKLRLKNHFVH